MSIIHVAYYDPATGAIIQCSSGDPLSLEADDRPYVRLDARPEVGFDMRHRVNLADRTVVPVAA